MGFYLERYSPVGAFENSVYDGVMAALDLVAGLAPRCSSPPRRTRPTPARILEHFGLAARFESINGARADGARAAKREIIGDIITAHTLKFARTRSHDRRPRIRHDRRQGARGGGDRRAVGLRNARGTHGGRRGRARDDPD